MSYVDRSYVGFREITLERPWELGKLPKIKVAERDTAGECIYNSSDSFFEFEDAVSSLHLSKPNTQADCSLRSGRRAAEKRERAKSAVAF